MCYWTPSAVNETQCHAASGAINETCRKNQFSIRPLGLTFFPAFRLHFMKKLAKVEGKSALFLICSLFDNIL